MNKKFLNAVLFGALLASSTGTFTSCKDYDDDINGLSERVDAVEKTLADLNTKFGALAYVKSVSFANGVLTVTDQSGTPTTYTIPDNDTNTTYTLDVSQDGNKATITLTDDKGNKQTKTITFTDTDTDTKFDATKLTVGEDGVVKYDGVATGVTIPKQGTLTITEMTTDGVTYGWAIKYGNAEPVNLMICDVLPITSFGFEPDAYLGGVPSMKALKVIYKAWGETTSCNPATATGEVWEKATTNSYVRPVIAGTYYLNPSSATKEQIKKITVLSADKEYINKTRAAASNPEVESYEVKDGVLTVYFKATTELIEAISSSKITVLAIRVETEAGNTITDEYRAIYATDYENVILGDKAKKAAAAAQHHLYGTTSGKADDAIKADADYEVAYNSTTGIDLADKVITCYDDVAANKTDLTMSAAELAKLGLKYDFHLCAYIDGTNQTNQSDFARLTGSVLYPKLFNETATPYAAVGRQPLVRVQLLDTKANNKVVSTGWIKVMITKDKAPAIDAPFTFDPFTNQCDDKVFALTVEQMNVKVYNKLGMDYKMFKTIYEAANPLYTGDGVVTEVADAGEVTQTDLLKWTISQADMKLALTKTSDVGSLKAVVTYKPKAGYEDSYSDVTITLSTKVNAIAAVTIPASNKIAEYWDANKTYVRLNVVVPGTLTDDCAFAVDLDNTFEGNKPIITGATAYKYIFASKNVNRKEKGLSGTEYTLSVSDDGLTLKATAGAATQNVAVIDADGVVTYQNTDFAKDLLNIASHNSVPSAGFYAWINIKATTGECALELPITNGEYMAYFLRPIDVIAGEGKFQDAVDNGSTVNMLDLLSFSDWRNQAFSTTVKANYFGYYGIELITVDIPNITTDLNGNDINSKKLSEVTSQLVITQTGTTVNPIPAAPAKDTYGTVTYTNNGNAVGAFNLRLPVTVTYKWGTVKSYVIIPVEKTLGN